MNSRYLRVVVLGTIAVGLALSQQACTPELGPTTAAPGSAAPTAPTATKPGTARDATPGQTREIPYEPEDDSTGSGGQDVEAGSVPGCLNKDIDLTVTGQDQDVNGDHRSGLVNLINISDHACKLRGHFAVALINAADETVEVPTEMVNEPGEAVTVVVQRGGGAYAGIKWTVCDKDDVDCGVGNSLRWNLQSSGSGKSAKLEDFPAPEKHSLTMGSLQIGTIQPIRVGVVAW
jgi:uncharacterized protein DUF4232